MKKKMIVIAAMCAASVASASAAALPLTDLSAGITEGITGATTLVTAGFAATALFIVVRLLKRGAYTATK